ncbi:helix-turn-helix transcriptional regulator [Chryseobacterium terrae]|uniref:Regulatory protein, luxR family n=1 Tax=Chryseobacterium terrae TaxID=3163299 RepID=A0ABW8Y091_9FLAO
MNKNRENAQDFNAEEYNAKISADEEIIRLAKQNSPRLLSKFKSAYPEFFENLAAVNANLQNSEIIFCIYLKLRLSTKEIALYTFVTPKAIQNRKNRLRKKLNIASTTDIYKWFDQI